MGEIILPKLPEEYIPFKGLIVCGNQFIRGVVTIRMKSKIPFLIGKGNVPLIWLNAPLTKDGHNWKEVIVKNESLNKKIEVMISKDTVSIMTNDKTFTVIKVNKLSDDLAEIIDLDLSPLGLNIYGDKSGLHIGMHSVSNNIFEAVHTMIAMD